MILYRMKFNVREEKVVFSSNLKSVKKWYSHLNFTYVIGLMRWF